MPKSWTFKSKKKHMKEGAPTITVGLNFNYSPDINYYSFISLGFVYSIFES